MAVQSGGGKEMQELANWKFLPPAYNRWRGAGGGEVLSMLSL